MDSHWTSARSASFKQPFAIACPIVPAFVQANNSFQSCSKGWSFYRGSALTTLASTVYRDLDATHKEIRLLTLLPGHEHDDLCGNFVHASLFDPVPTYETISYAWGDAADRGTIRISGHELHIPKSAEVALRRVRQVEEPRSLWIDSVCINQEVLHERESQVALMHEIYGLGFQNLIWLGPASEHTKAAIESIARLAEGFRESTHDLADITAFVDGTLSTGPLTTDIDHTATVEYYERPWFRRLWVIQEACLSPQSICLTGTFEIPLVSVLRAGLVLARAVWFLPESWRRTPQLFAQTMAALVEGVTQPTIAPVDGALYMLLTTMHQSECSDPRDRVYGIIGLYLKFSTGSTLPQVLIPDYNISVWTAYENASIQAIIEKKDLALLRYVSPTTEHAELPSWVPDYSVVRTQWGPLPTMYNADNNLPMQLHDIQFEPGLLKASGFFIDCVEQVKPALWQTPDLHQNAKEMLQGFRELEALLTSSSKELGWDDLARLVGILQVGTDRFQGRLNEQQSVAAYVRLQDYLSTHDTVPDANSPKDDDEQDILNLLFSLSMWCRGRSVFQTSKAYLGLGVGKMLAGDVLTILFGSKYPVLLLHLTGPTWNTCL